MADAAARLRAAREAAGLSIEEVSARTKIKPAMLHAIEQGDYRRLPGDFFARAFLRTYARELHVPESEVLEAYASDVPAAVVPPAAFPPRALPTVNVERRESRPLRTGWVLAAAATFAMVLLFTTNGGGPEREPEAGAVGTSGNALAAPQASGSTQLSAAPPERLSIELRPTRPVWITGHADSERVLFRQVEPGERITLDAADRLTFRVGDAGALDFSLNGLPGRAPGRDGEVREFTITRANYREFVR